jgi:hypothetical protein
VAQGFAVAQRVTGDVGTPSGHQLHVEGGDDRIGNRVLDREDVVEGVLVAFCPDAVAAHRVDELRIDT